MVDGQGNAVAVTYTLNGGYGNGITVPGLGFLLNNGWTTSPRSRAHRTCSGWCRATECHCARQASAVVDDADHPPQGRQEAVHDRRRPGGSRISTAVMQVILNVVDFGMNIQDAIDAPRIHHQWQPDKPRSSARSRPIRSHC